VRPKGYVTHGTDRPLWAFRRDVLKDDQISIARAWLNAVDAATTEVEKTGAKPVDEVLTLKEDGQIGWTKDQRWKEMESLAKVVESRKDAEATAKL